MKNRIKKPSIERLARRAGVKSLSIDCYPLIRKIMLSKIHEIVKVTLVTNSENNTKTVMSNDINSALSLLGYNVGESTTLSANTCVKN